MPTRTGRETPCIGQDLPYPAYASHAALSRNWPKRCQRPPVQSSGVFGQDSGEVVGGTSGPTGSSGGRLGPGGPSNPNTTRPTRRDARTTTATSRSENKPCALSATNASFSLFAACKRPEDGGQARGWQSAVRERDLGATTLDGGPRQPGGPATSGWGET